MVGWARKKFEMTNFTVTYNVSSMIGALRSVPGFADMMLGSSMGTGMASEASRGLRFGKGCMCILTPLINVAMNANSLIPVFVQEWTGM